MGVWTLDCRPFYNPRVRDIADGWIAYIDRSKPNPLRPMFMRIAWLADGQSFTCSDMRRIAECIDKLDGTKPDVRIVNEWFNGTIQGIPTRT